MTNDLISREAAVELLRDKAQHYTVSMFATSGECYVARVVATEAASEIAHMPAVDAAPVVHGRWIDEIEPNAITASGREVHVFRCSSCDFTWANKTSVLHYFRYCPNCGARMNKEE